MGDQNSKSSTWTSIFQLILPSKRTFTAVVIISLLSTGVNLIEPLIYREAINDIAGLFVQKAKDETRMEYETDEDTPGGAPVLGSDSSTVADATASSDSILVDAPDSVATSQPGAKLPHRRSHVASRTPEQALETLLWSVAILFVAGFVGHLLKMVGDNMNVRMSCNIEQGFIQSTFAHVLSLPLGFFGKRSSGALAKQINQSEEVSAVINGLSQEILPEMISLTGILVIMFFQNVTLTLIALSIIPFYLLIAWKSASRLESSIDKYYEQWEEVSARVQDALGGIKTVKLSGAEERETREFKKLADGAYADYVLRARKSNSYVFWESMLTRIATGLVLGYGGYLTLENRLTPGDVVMFVAYLDRLYDPIDTLSSLWVNLQQQAAHRCAKAFELSEQKRLDIEMKRLSARINRIHENPDWGSEPPDDIKEVDFQYLLHFQKKNNMPTERVHTLNSYGIYLAALGRFEEAGQVLQEALNIHPSDALTWINLGNLYDQEGKRKEAQDAYEKAVTLDPDNARVHYNLGLLFLEDHKTQEARSEFEKAKKLDPSDSDAVLQLRMITK